MDLKLNFIFRDTCFSCNAFIDNTDYPCYLFVELTDKDLAREFGEEITIKTDFDKLLPEKDDYPGVMRLQDAILDSVKKIPGYEVAKQECQQHKNWVNENL